MGVKMDVLAAIQPRVRRFQHSPEPFAQMEDVDQLLVALVAMPMDPTVVAALNMGWSFSVTLILGVITDVFAQQLLRLYSCALSHFEWMPESMYRRHFIDSHS